MEWFANPVQRITNRHRDTPAIMPDLKPTLVGLSISMLVIATFVVALRFVARVSKKLKVQADDYFALAALVRIVLDFSSIQTSELTEL